MVGNDGLEKPAVVTKNEPPICADLEDANAAWNVPLRACRHKVPVDTLKRGSQWSELWPARLDKTPYWLTSSQVGVYGRAAPGDFTAGYEHWKRVVVKSYLMGCIYGIFRTILSF